LSDAVTHALGAPAMTADNVYLHGRTQKRLDARMVGAVAFAVDRHDKRLAWEIRSDPPLVLLRVASEALVCCAASPHGSHVLVHPAPTLGLGPRRLPREHVDLLGRVIAVLRRPTR
jgi:hypothetical protein